MTEDEAHSPGNEEETVDEVVNDAGNGHDESPAPRSKSKSRSRSRTRSRSRSGSRHGRRRRRRRSRSKSRSRSRRRARRRRSPSYSRSRSRSYSRSRDKKRRRRSRSRSYSRSRSRSPRYPRSKYLGPRDCPPPSRCVGIFGMNLSTTENSLAHFLQGMGKIDKIQVVYDAKSGRSRGFGFVYFEDLQDAIDAKEKISGAEIEGNRVRADFSLTHRPHTPTPGIYMGKPMSYRDDYYQPRYGYGGGRSPSPYYRSRRSRSRSYS